MSTKKRPAKVVSMFSLSRYMMAKAQTRLAKANARHEKRVNKATKKKDVLIEVNDELSQVQDELFAARPVTDLPKLYDELAAVSAKQEAHDHSKCNHDH